MKHSKRIAWEPPGASVMECAHVARVYGAGLGPEPPHTIDSLKQLVALYGSWNKPDEAAKWRAQLPAEEE